MAKEEQEAESVCITRRSQCVLKLNEEDGFYMKYVAFCLKVITK
jgi:hypothetical protein